MDALPLNETTTALFSMGGIGIVVGVLVEISKSFGVEKKFLQLLSVLIGTLLGTTLAFYNSSDPVQGANIGLIAGAMVTGLYGAVKNPITK